MHGPFIKTTLVALLFSLLCSTATVADELPWDTSTSTAWAASGGQARIQMGAEFLPGFGVKVTEADRQIATRFTTRASVTDGSLWIYAPFGNFEEFVGGSLTLRSTIELQGAKGRVSLDGFDLVPARLNDVPMLQIRDQRGRHLANITHSHVVIQASRDQLLIHNADIKATKILADILGAPDVAGLAIGQIWIDLGINIPADANLSGIGIDRSGGDLSCTGRPFWPQDGFEVDVGLETIGSIAGGGFDPDTGRLKITPSATLKNLGAADVPWFRQFEPAAPSVYPHEPRDQHPFLVWNLYRIFDGRLEQLAASGTKHAFFTINVNCDLNCGSGQILWPGCEDTYGVFNNDSSTYQGPRSEIDASQGLWDSCNSFFDTDCNGSQDGFAGNWNNRLLVEPTELDLDARYFVDAWYVIQYDVNIWNTMGFHEINPAAGGSGGYNMNPGPFQQGPPINAWVDENTANPLEAHSVLVIDGPTPTADYPDNMPAGQTRVLAKAEDLGDGDFTYRYAVMNYDFDQGFSEFVVPIPDGAIVSDTFMGGPPDVMLEAWQIDIENNAVRFTAPAGQKLPWFTLYNFEITVDQAPAVDGAVSLAPFVSSVRPAGEQLSELISVGTVAPAGLVNSQIFEDRFED